MILNQDVWPKQPTEIAIYNGRWTRALARVPGRVIVSSVWSVYTPDDATLVLSQETGVSADGEVTSVRVAAGTPGVTYVLKNRVTLSTGEIWHGYGALRVESEAALLQA